MLKNLNILGTGQQNLKGNDAIPPGVEDDPLILLYKTMLYLNSDCDNREIELAMEEKMQEICLQRITGMENQGVKNAILPLYRGILKLNPERSNIEAINQTLQRIDSRIRRQVGN